eukprot:48783-Eustigmatos_ZCMA.PRE.1
MREVNEEASRAADMLPQHSERTGFDSSTMLICSAPQSSLVYTIYTVGTESVRPPVGMLPPQAASLTARCTAPLELPSHTLKLSDRPTSFGMSRNTQALKLPRTTCSPP